MIVLFFVFISMILFLTLGIKVKIEYFNIENLEKLNSILDMLALGENKAAFKYINFKVRLQICLFNYVPIFQKIISNNNTDLNKQSKNNKLINKLKDKIISNIEITNFKYNAVIGCEDTVLVTSLVTIMSILISSILPYFIDKRKKDRVFYKVEPKYKKDLFYMNLALNLRIPIYKIIWIYFNIMEIITI